MQADDENRRTEMKEPSEHPDILQIILELKSSGMSQVPDTQIAEKAGLSLSQVHEALQHLRQEGKIILCEMDEGYAVRAWDRVTG